jgi:hypothetical protein
MKSFFILTCLGLMISTTVIADDAAKWCANGAGTVVTSNNGTKYCMSRNIMNWWTALNWCETINKTPISYPEDCFCAGEKCPIDTLVLCPNFKLNGMQNIRGWTKTPARMTDAWTIYLDTGNVLSAYASNRDNNYMFRAICK